MKKSSCCMSYNALDYYWIYLIFTDSTFGGKNNSHCMLQIYFIWNFHKVKWLNFVFQLKGCVLYILLVCFSSLKKSTCETRKNIFYFTSKLFSFLRKSNFTILDIQVSWRHQMSKRKTRNMLYWVTWEVNTIC